MLSMVRTATPRGGGAMAWEPQIRRQRGGRVAWLCALGVTVLVLSWQAKSDAFASAEGAMLRSSSRDASAVAMEGGNRRQRKRNLPKKCHPKFQEERYKKWATDVPAFAQRLFFCPEATLADWSHTLKLNFPDGEDDAVTEEEVMEYFTTKEYQPEAVIVGHQMPHEEVKHTYVHFSCNADAKKARKEKDGGQIGKASEVKLVFTDEKKWIRLRDGVSLAGGWWGPRARWMKAYGTDAYKGYRPDEPAVPTGVRNHWYYPEE